jgi:hypothetical protein
VPPRSYRAECAKLAILIAVCLGWTGLPLAEPSPPDSTAAAAAVPDSTLAAPRGFDSPTAVMFRSLLIPGWGQAKNGAWLKAILVAGIEGAFLERIAFEDRMAHRFASHAATFAPDDPDRDSWDAGVLRHRNHRRDFIWWTSLFVFLSMGDAYTDAHLKRFDVRLQDETPPPDPGSGASVGPGRQGLQIAIETRW